MIEIPDIPLWVFIAAGAIAFYVVTLALGTVVLRYFFGSSAGTRFHDWYGFPWELVAWGVEELWAAVTGVLLYPWHYRKLRLFQESFYWRPRTWRRRLYEGDHVLMSLASYAGTLQAYFDHQIKIQQAQGQHVSHLQRQKEDVDREVATRKENFRLAQSRAKALGFRVPSGVKDYQHKDGYDTYYNIAKMQLEGNTAPTARAVGARR